MILLCIGNLLCIEKRKALKDEKARRVIQFLYLHSRAEVVAFFCNFHMVDYVMRTYSFFFKPLHKKAPFFTSFIAGRFTILVIIVLSL